MIQKKNCKKSNAKRKSYLFYRKIIKNLKSKKKKTNNFEMNLYI